MSKKVFFIAAVESQEPFQFWQGSITVEGKDDIDSLETALVKEHAQSHSAFAAAVYQPQEPHAIDNMNAETEFPDLQTLYQKATPVPPYEIIQDVLPDQEHILVLLQCVAPQIEADGSLKAHALYEKAWGKAWPSVVNEISRTDIGQFGEDEVFPYPPYENNVPEKLQYHCLNGMKEVARTFGLGTDFQDVVVVLREYTLLRDWLYTNEENIVVVGQPGTGKTTFLLYLLLYRLQRKEPTAIQFSEGRYFSFDENGVRVLSDREPFEESDRFWALSDANDSLQKISTAFYFAPRVIQASSPQEERWNPWIKQKGGLPIILELPTVLEIAAVLKELRRQTSKTLDLVGRWGPSIRMISSITLSEGLEASMNKVYESQVSKALQKQFRDPSNFLASSADTQKSGQGSLVFFLRPPPESNATTRTFDLTYDYFIPTKFLHSMAMDHFTGLSNQKVHELYSQLLFHSASRSPAGFMFEGLMHLRMSERDPLKLTDQESISMDMQTSSNLVHGTIDSLKEQKPSRSFYWRPATLNFPGIDSVLSDGQNLFLLQATVPGKHRNPKDGILKVWNTMSKQVVNRFVWHVIAVTDKESKAESLRRTFSRDLEGFHLGVTRTVVKVWSCVLAEQEWDAEIWSHSPVDL